MRLPLALVLILLLAGCTAPAPDPETGPIALPQDQLGLLLLDVVERDTLVLSIDANRGWMSPSGGTLVYEEAGYHVLLNRSRQSALPAVVVPWTRIDDGTGLVLEPGRASTLLITNGSSLATSALPPSPRPDGAWTSASADLRVLAAEWAARADAPPCGNTVVILEPSTNEDLTRTGCHVRVAGDGRAGWTEATGVWVREVNGTVRDVTGGGRDVNGTFVAHENPVFTQDGLRFLRLAGGARLAKTEIVDEPGTVIARLDGSYRVALLDASLDGRLLLLRIFER